MNDPLGVKSSFPSVPGNAEVMLVLILNHLKESPRNLDDSSHVIIIVIIMMISGVPTNHKLKIH